MLVTLPATWTAAATLRLYDTADHSDTPIDVAVTSAGGTLSADVASVPPGRYYPRLVGTAPSGPVTYDLGLVDLPDNPDMVVTPEAVASKAGIPLPLNAATRDTLTEAILDAQADVVAYLGRAIVPEVRVEADRYAWGDGWNLVALGDEPLIRILDTEAQIVDGVVTGYFTITYLCGIDARLDPALRPIRRFVMLHAMNSPDVVTLWRRVTGSKGEVRSVSAEGQSVSFATATLSGSATTGTRPGDMTPGSLPTLSSLDRWRLAGRRVHQARTLTSDWPFSGDRW